MCTPWPFGGRDKHEFSGPARRPRRQSASKAVNRCSRPCRRPRHYMLWLIEPTRTNWRISHRVVNTFFALFGTDFGLTRTEDTTHSDSTVDHPCIALWISRQAKSQCRQKVIHRHLEWSSTNFRDERHTTEHRVSNLLGPLMWQRSHAQDAPSDRQSLRSNECVCA